jgi:hypothetical protein
MSFALALALGVAPPATAREDAPSPLAGAWDFNPTQGHCPERHVYRDDGTLEVRSGSEVLAKTWTARDLGGGVLEVEQVVTATNGGSDCLGGTSTVGARGAVVLMPVNGGGWYTCAGADGMSCYGSLRASTDEAPVGAGAATPAR